MERTIKIIVIGDSGVGKTAFVGRYIDNKFDQNYKTTLGVDFYHKIVDWSDNVKLKLQIWDIAGQDRFTQMSRVFYQHAQGCIIMFDVTKPETFRNVDKWKSNLDNKCNLTDGSTVPCMILANKCDLEELRKVTGAEVDAFCVDQQIEAGWHEVSVKENIKIEESVMKLLEVLLARVEQAEKVQKNNTNDINGSEFQTISLTASTSPTQDSDRKEKISNCKC